MTNIHPTAIISEGAELDTEVSVGAYSVVGPNVKIGSRTKIHSHVVLEGRTFLGEENEIFPFASIGTAPQDLKYSGEPSTLQIGNKNKIREYVTIQPGTRDGYMTTRVGSGNLFMANCHVGHDCIVGDDNVFANSVALAGHVEIHNHAIIGGLAGIHQFARIGTLAFIGAGSMVSQDVPPFSIVQGDRAVMRGINIIGLRRAGISTDELASIKKAFKLLFLTSGAIKDRLESLPKELLAVSQVQMICAFVEASKRGLVSSSKTKNSDENIE